MQRVLIEKIGVCDDFIATEVSEVIEPPAKRQKSLLDCLLGDESEEGGSSVSISVEVEEYFQEHPIRCKDDPFC